MMSSVEIAQMAMMQQQQFSMMNASFGRPDQMAGHALNSAAAVGGPGIMGMMGMLGIDPMSIGMSAGMSALTGSGLIGSLTGGAGLGLAGSMGVGIGAAAAVGVPMMGAGYIGHQMMAGAQQQQYLNSTLARSFNFNGNGRRGFSRSDSSAIGMAMREMSHDVGPNGELTSMRELTDIAGKMGQMGMMKGVRDAQEFNSKFREMVKTMKTIATEMNTSMSQAMEMMQASKSSGMFNQMDQMRFVRNVQNVAASSGLATSEVSAMGNIGSQISRAYGGLGKQGAIGGMRAIGQVGGALQSGVLSEEDIYNATGLTGAEGRQAFASNMMSQTGSFLRSGKGRWFMASMAGANGTIDEEAASRYMLGNVGVGDTRGMAGKHLNEVGRANFIRNEGRLRGAVMERFGAVAPAVALMGWASEKGIDINNMDDRSMLFAQRHLGMGRDEVDAAVKMAQDLPRIMRSQMEEGSSAAVTNRYGNMMKNRGVEGIKRRFEHAKEKINSGMQQTGADMYQELTDYIGGLIDNWTGTAVPEATANIGTLWRQALRSGDKRSMQAITGMGGMGSASGMSRMSWNQFNSGGALSFLTGGGELKERLEKAGFKDRIDQIGNMTAYTQDPGGQRAKSAPAQQQEALNKLLEEASAIQQAVTSNVREVTVQGKLRTSLLESYAGGAVGKAGLGDRGAAVEKVLAENAAKGDTNAKEMLSRYRGIKSSADKAAFVAGVEKSLGITGSNSMSSMGDYVGNMDGATMERFQGMTGRQRDEAFGAQIRGSSGESFQENTATSWKQWVARAAGAMVFGALGSVAGPMGTVAGGAAGVAIADKLYSMISGKKGDAAGDLLVGKAARSLENRKLMLGVLNGDADARDQALAIIGNASSSNATGDEKANAVVARNILAAGEIQAALKEGGGTLSEEAKQRLLRQHNGRGGDARSFEDLQRSADATYATMKDQSNIDRKRVQSDHKQDARDRGGRLEAMGVLKYDEKTAQYTITAKAQDGIKNSKMSIEAARLEMEMLNKEASGDIEGYFQSRQKHQAALGKMGVKELSAHVSAMGDQDAAVLLSDAKRFRSGRHGALGLANVMGIGGGETKAEKRSLMAAMGKGTDAYLDEFIKQTGLTGTAATGLRSNEDFRKAVESARSGKSDGVDIAALTQKAKESVPGLGEALQKKAESRMGPQEKMAASMSKIEAALVNFKPEAIGAQFATSIGPILQGAINGQSVPSGAPAGGGKP